MSIHTGRNPFVCYIRAKCFATKSRLYYHSQTKHCDTQQSNESFQCENWVGYLQSFSLHMRSHTEKNTFLCDVCGKAVSSLEPLWAHWYIHTGENPNISDICGKAFTKIEGVKVHKHTRTGIDWILVATVGSHSYSKHHLP